ncbi:MAG: molybdenum cofactor guanylyltransferase [Candidatus Methylacidiphilales bacterium]|nr:NTP transferase domain-containing protein [Candidatus Methylacidiphilales bacterium]
MQPPPSEDVALSPFKALLIAGGRSSRMGQDKALVANNVGIPLYLLQRRLLQSVGPQRLLLSGRAGVSYEWPPEDILFDTASDCGPLAAIEALSRFNLEDGGGSAPLRTLVLAVDLPFMSADYLGSLLRRGPAGSVATTDGRLEPLVAVYPPAVVDLARVRFHEGVRAVHHVLEEAIQRGLMEPVEVPCEFRRCFLNLTTKEDLARWLSLPSDLPV